MMSYKNFIHYLNHIIFICIIKEKRSTFKNSTLSVTNFVRIDDQRLIQINNIIDDKTKSTDLMKNKHECLIHMISDLKQILYSLSSTSRKNDMIKQISINYERDNKSKSLIEIKINLVFTSASASDSSNHETADSNND